MKLKKIIDSQAALIKLTTQRLPILMSWDISKTLKSLDPEINAFIECRKKLITELGIPIEGQRDQYRFEGENAIHFDEETTKMLDQEITVEIKQYSLAEVMKKIEEANKKLDEKNRIELIMTPGDMLLLDWLFID